MKWLATVGIMAFGLLIVATTNIVFQAIFPDAPDRGKVISAGVVGGLFGVAFAFMLRYIRRLRANRQL